MTSQAETVLSRVATLEGQVKNSDTQLSNAITLLGEKQDTAIKLLGEKQDATATLLGNNMTILGEKQDATSSLLTKGIVGAISLSLAGIYFVSKDLRQEIREDINNGLKLGDAPTG